MVFRLLLIAKELSVCGTKPFEPYHDFQTSILDAFFNIRLEVIKQRLSQPLRIVFFKLQIMRGDDTSQGRMELITFGKGDQSIIHYRVLRIYF